MSNGKGSGRRVENRQAIEDNYAGVHKKPAKQTSKPKKEEKK